MAQSYIAAIAILAPQADEAFEPFHMMVGHAIELSLKAAMAHAGCDEEWLMMSGHNLHRCLQEVRSLNFSGHADERLATLVEILDGPHHDQRFRYPVLSGGTPRLLASDAAETLQLVLEDVRLWLSTPL